MKFSEMHISHAFFYLCLQVASGVFDMGVDMTTAAVVFFPCETTTEINCKTKLEKTKYSVYLYIYIYYLYNAHYL